MIHLKRVYICRELNPEKHHRRSIRLRGDEPDLDRIPKRISGNRSKGALTIKTQLNESQSNGR